MVDTSTSALTGTRERHKQIETCVPFITVLLLSSKKTSVAETTLQVTSYRKAFDDGSLLLIRR